MLARRIIPCLDVRHGQVVKGVRFRDHRVVGDIVEFAARYAAQGADELVFYDITASPEGRKLDHRWIERVAREIDIPFCVAGGIVNLESARRILGCGADKISINTPALTQDGLIEQLAETFGSQCVVVGIDSVREGDGYRVRQYTGDPEKTRDSAWNTLDWVAAVQQRGGGEIVLNCMDCDGVQQGYNIAHVAAVCAHCTIPVIASGGAGEMAHFSELFTRTHASGALAASVFHSGEIRLSDLKKTLIQQGIPIRP